MPDAQWTGTSARQSDWLFRGQPYASDGLVPSAWRDPHDKRDFVRLVTGPIERAKADWIAKRGDPKDAWNLQQKAEGLLLGEWVRLAQRDGYDLPGDQASGDGMGPEPNHPLATLARHHGLPSRLLDFTRRPLVAMFWAMEGAPTRGNGHLAVWAVREGGWAPPARQPYNHPRWGNANLLAQDGVTVEPPMPDEFLRVHNRFPRLEEVAGIPRENLRKLTLPHTEVQELRRLLEIEGVTKARLVPGYAGVTETVLARFREE